LESPELNQRLGGRILIKPANLQRCGSFKFRGAFNRLSLIPEAIRARGVVAYSSGNHAQGVAASAQIYGVPATIVMPSDAPRVKIENTKAYGAKVVLYDRFGEDRAAVADAILARSGATLVKPYDDLGVIAGQGTCGLEIVRQAEAMKAKLDAVLVCCGGGGLTAGIALAVDALSPATEVFTVEPEGFDDTLRSLETGERMTNRPDARSICDAIVTPSPGELTFALNRRLLKGGLAVSDEEVLRAVAFAFRKLKLVVEPGGAVCLAAVLSGKLPVAGRTIALTLSGGNVDAERMMEALALD